MAKHSPKAKNHPLVFHFANGGDRLVKLSLAEMVRLQGAVKSEGDREGANMRTLANKRQ